MRYTRDIRKKGEEKMEKQTEDKGLVFLIGTTDVKELKTKLQNEEYILIENKEDVIHSMEHAEKEVVFFIKKEDESWGSSEALSLQGNINRKAKEVNKNVYIVTELPAKMNERYATYSDFRHSVYEGQAAVIVGMTEKGNKRVKNRFGDIGVIAEQELFAM